MIPKIDKITAAKERKKKEETRGTFSLDTRVGERDAVPPGCRIASTTGTLRRLCRRVVVPPPPLGCRFPCAGRRPAGFGDGGGADHWGASTMGSAAASVGEERGVERMGTIVRVERKV
jgi:hypothetical protein